MCTLVKNIPPSTCSKYYFHVWMETLRRKQKGTRKHKECHQVQRLVGSIVSILSPYLLQLFLAFMESPSWLLTLYCNWSVTFYAWSGSFPARCVVHSMYRASWLLLRSIHPFPFLLVILSHHLSSDTSLWAAPAYLQSVFHPAVSLDVHR